MAPTRTERRCVTAYLRPAPTDTQASVEFSNAAARDASSWNSLLRWHRRNRGPQWDYSTAMYQVDQGSREYYAGVEKLELSPTKPEVNPRESPERPTLRKSDRVLKDKDAESMSAAGALDHSYSTTMPQSAPNTLPPMPVPQLPTQQPPAIPKAAFPQTHDSSVTGQNDIRQQYEAMYNIATTQNTQRSLPQLQQAAGSPTTAMPQQLLPQPIAPNALGMRIPGGLPQQMPGVNNPGQTSSSGVARFPGQLR